MSLLLLAALLVPACALRIPFARRAPPADVHVLSSANGIGQSSLDLKTVRDLIYMANVTVGATTYPVQLDTGSSDLWLFKNSTDPLPNVNETPTMINLTYGLGWAYGKLSYADVEFSGVRVSNQGFVHAQTVNNPAMSYGAQGILGLGFTSLSNIDVSQSSKQDYSGRSLLYNMFATNPKEPNFISFSLQRSTEPGDEVEGAFSVGEYDPDYAHVANMEAISTFPESNPSRWNVLVDAIIIGEKVITPTTNIPNAPANKAVSLLDTGTSYSYVPKEVSDAIYSSVPGAKYDSTSGYWDIPCNTEVDIAIQIAGQVYPLHPLDITPVSLTDSNTCIGSFVGQSVSVSEGQFDWLLGDNVLRAMYTLFDFGDYDSSGQMGNPYVKLLSIVEPDQASKEFAANRNSTAKSGITYNAADGTIADSKSTSVNLSTDVAKSLNLVGKVFPIMLAIMGLNAIVLLGLLIFGIWYMCRKKKGRSSRVPARTTRGRLSPMPMEARHSYMPGNAPISTNEQIVYQPVSMAMTEDTFVPPSASFHKFESHIQPGDRPRSMAVPLRVSRPSTASMDERDEPFEPPTPAFHMDGAHLRPGGAARGMVDRPNSVA